MGEELLVSHSPFPVSGGPPSKGSEQPPRLCQEGLQCSQETPAEYFCHDCGSYQCSQCESFLHCNKELKQHNRKKLNSATSVSVCKLWCKPKNSASLFCQQCSMDMCVECDAKMHQGRRKDHVRVTAGSTTNHDSGGGVRGKEKCNEGKSFLLVNNNEELLVTDENVFIQQLGCGPADKVKVVSIFGNTGDGKSYTLNYTFFRGQEVFHTSAQQSSCTIGAWAAYSPEHKTIFLDSEGLLGASKNENRRTRLLLKVLAISDVVIYRTRAERLHNDLFAFLGDASDAYWKYFTPELKSASDRCHLNVPLSTLGPSVVIFHETQHTEILGEGATATTTTTDNLVVINPPSKESSSSETPPPVVLGPETKEHTEADVSLDERDGTTPRVEMNANLLEDIVTPTPPMSAEELLRIRFSEQGRIPKAFCSIEYVGTRTQWPPTDFSGLETSVTSLLKNNAVRAPRTPAVVLKALQVLNDKFSGDIENVRTSTFPDAYFTCPQECLACGVRCSLSMNHLKDGVPHKIADSRCKYSHTYDNRIYLCKTCFNRGIESVVVPKTSTSTDSGWLGIAKYAWAGFVIECKQCGVIYRSRQHWYGNKEPELDAVKTENKHIWPEDLPAAGQGSDNTARRLLDSVGNMAGAVGSVSSRPTKMVTSWMADRVAPSYWTPNSKITECGDCKKEFVSPSETKHHCRACGGGFCEKCSSKTMPVPWRGWGNIPVRVCNTCYTHHHKPRKTTDKQTRDSSSTAPKQTTTLVARTEHKEESTKIESSETKVTARYVGEVMQSAVGLVTGAITYPKGMIVESARPVYWVPDDKITSCYSCKTEFRALDSKHHCRACGQGFCDQCSSKQRPVPSRGWDYPVRVCDSCASRTDL